MQLFAKYNLYRFFMKQSVSASQLDKFAFTSAFEDGKMPLEKLDFLILLKLFEN